MPLGSEGTIRQCEAEDCIKTTKTLKGIINNIFDITKYERNLNIKQVWDFFTVGCSGVSHIIRGRSQEKYVVKVLFWVIVVKCIPIGGGVFGVLLDKFISS